MKPEYEDRFFLTPGESNAEAEMPLTLLATRIIEVATRHANTLQIGYEQMHGDNLGWVLGRLTIEMKRYPRVNEHYSLRTWIQGFNRMFSERNFEIKDGDGNPIGYARTIWMIIDTSTHRNAGLQGFNLDPALILGEDCPIARQAKHRPIEQENPRRYTFRYSDIDFYRHVNTVRYIELLCNSFSLEKFDSQFPQRFEIAFMRECKYGMEVEIPHITDEDGADCVEIRQDGKPLVSARFVFKPRTK